MSSLPSLVARGCLRSRNLYPRLSAVHVRPSQHRSGISTATLSVPRDGGLLLNPNVATPLSPALKINQEEIFGAVTDDPFAMRLPEPAAPEPFKDLGIPRPLRTALQQEFPHILNPTSAQKELVESVLKDGKDVFLKDKTGQGKTFALTLIALSRALKIRSKRSKAAKNPPRSASRSSVSPATSILLLLPHATLVRQVGSWMERLEFAMSGSQSAEGEKERMFRMVLPGDEQGPGSGATPEIIISSPDALLTYLQASASRQHPADGQRAPVLTSASLSRSLRLVMIDEADAMLRPLPGRFKSFTSERERQRHPFFRHPPSIVRLLDDLFGRDGDMNGGKKQVQTVWCSATLNSVIRGFVHRSGWIRRDEQVIIDTAQESSDTVAANTDTSTTANNGIKETAHYCLTVDPLTGTLRNIGSAPTQPSYSDIFETAPDDPAAKEKIHPLMIENLALLHASRSATAPENNGVSLVIVPEGGSVPKLQASLQSLGVSSSTLDGTQDPDVPNLLLVARSHVRGLDIPNISAVYLLNGLNVTSLSKSARAAGGVEERKREYTHFAGRMGRLGAQDGEEREGKGERYALVSLVMRDSAEEKAVQAMFADKVALKAEVLKGEGISD
ncbi:hypothetical protein QFC21_003475 [Naganishia friedmannii]|uniref:Uncharacterized protein n=1 Tax=Naganishia friedmannii TaxID=89922 RepID=A0ACC2VQ47_9TREE|nr:hypothetical protein QFC21_003475 [Naganishia friedmannii]